MAGGAAQAPLLCGHAARLDHVAPLHDFGLVEVFDSCAVPVSGENSCLASACLTSDEANALRRRTVPLPLPCLLKRAPAVGEVNLDREFFPPAFGRRIGATGCDLPKPGGLTTEGC
jgi:hypothetical protein